MGGGPKNFLLLLNTVVILVLIFILFKLQDIDVNLQEIDLKLRHIAGQNSPGENEDSRLGLWNEVRNYRVRDTGDVAIEVAPNQHKYNKYNLKDDAKDNAKLGVNHDDKQTADQSKRKEKVVVRTRAENEGLQNGGPVRSEGLQNDQGVPVEKKGKVHELIKEPQGATTAFPLLKQGETYMKKLDGFNVVSMSLWGKTYKYTKGAIRNAELIKVFFPGWKLRIYVELPSDSPSQELVPNDILDKLTTLGVDLNFIDPSETKIAPMMWRFLVADDMSVDRFIIRDSDSRLSARDSAAVYAWVQSGKPLHCVRDHPSHSMAALSGGMWGGNPATIRNLMRRPFKQLMYGYKPGYGEDMGFLNSVIWARLKDSFYCSDSVSCDRYTSSHPFPIPRYGYEHIGQVFDDHGLSRPVDIQILRQSRENYKCSPRKPATEV